MGHFDAIYNIVMQVPRGRVATYGQIAQKVKSQNSKLKTATQNSKVTPRMVGQAMHRNPDPKRIPCHRVVNHRGRIADAYAFGGAREQKEKLIAENVPFKSEKYVDLKICLWGAN